MLTSPVVDLVQVSPEEAEAQSVAITHALDDATQSTLAGLRTAGPLQSFVLGPGTHIAVTLWSFSPKAGAGGPGSTPLGNFTLASDGMVSLPFVKPVMLTGLTQVDAQELIAKRYAALGLFQSPSILVDVVSSPQGQVLVTGAVGLPRSVPWPPNGLTLAEALSQALGDGAALLGQDGDTASRFNATTVSVYRGHQASTGIPIALALEEEIPLRPGDRVVVKKSPAVEVTVLGAGVQNNSVYAFAHIPSLSEVLARGSGLNPNAANNHAVFVLRERPGQKPVLYDFAWNKAQGVVASHRFPMQSNDLVYVAEAPIVSVQRVINILFQVALPAQIAK